MSTGNSNNVSPSASPGVGSSNAPKYGTLVPNRVFVGGISPHTTETELHQLFSSYGNVKATKIIQDRAGVSKGYGFVTFETEDEARRLQNEGDNIIFKDRKLNIAPAIKKQPFSRMFDPSTASPTGTVLFHNGMPYTYQNGMAVFPPQEYGSYPTQPQYPVMYPQPVIMPQQNFQYQANHPQWPQSNSHWRWTPPIGYAPQPTSGHQYVYAHSVPPSQSAGVQVITIPQQQPVAPATGEFYVSQPPPVYHHQEAQAAAVAAAEHDYQQEVKNGSSDWPEDRLDRLSALCLDDLDANGPRACPLPAENGGTDTISESGDERAPSPVNASAETDSVPATPGRPDPCSHSPSPLPLTPPSSSVSPCADSVSVSSNAKSASPQPTLGESGFASHVSSSGTEQDSCDGEPSSSKSPSKPPKYTILAPQMSQVYMTPNAVPHYHIWTPYYTLQTSTGSIQARAGGKGCPRHGYAPLPPPGPPPSMPPPLSAGPRAPSCWPHQSGPRAPSCWPHQSGPRPPIPIPSYPCPIPPRNEPFSPPTEQMQRVRYASPCKPPLSRGGYICGPRAGAAAGRSALKQPDLGGAGDAPPPRTEQGAPITPPPTPGRADQPPKVEAAATRLQTMTL